MLTENDMQGNLSRLITNDGRQWVIFAYPDWSSMNASLRPIKRIPMMVAFFTYEKPGRRCGELAHLPVLCS